jgi:hypothetical protein
MMRAFTLIIYLFAALPAIAQDNPATQAEKLLRTAIECPIIAFYDSACKSEGGCTRGPISGLLSSKVEQTYTGNAKIFREKGTSSIERRYPGGINTENTMGGMEAKYKDLDAGRIAISATPQAKRAMITFRCRSPNCMAFWEDNSPGTATGKRTFKASEHKMSFCNKEAAEDAKLAIEILIKANTK